GVTEFSEGSLVTVEEIQYCGACRACRGGYPNSCERIEDIGFTIDGGFAEYVRVPARAAWSLDPLLDRYGTPDRALEVGALCQPVLAVIDRTRGVGGKTAIIGMDPVSATLDLIRYQLKAGSVYGSVGHCGGWNFPNVINLMASGRIEMEHAVTRRSNLAQMVD